MNLSEQQRHDISMKAKRGEILLAPDGPVIERFDPLLMAQAMEHEIARARSLGQTKISIHMDIEESVELARGLRKLGLLR